MIKYFSMFSGIGGFEVGMHNSRYKDELECIGFSEVNKYAISIYSRWFPNHRNYGDATTIDTSELDDFSLLIGGFPCQSFSIAGGGKDLTIQGEHCFLKSQGFLPTKDPNIFYSKMLKVFYLTTREKLSRQFLGSSMNWGMMYYGKLIIPKTMEFHRIVSDYSLKDILESNVEEKYYLPKKKAGELMN